MAGFDVYIYIDGVPINGNKKYPSSTTFEITSTGLILGNSQVWTYSGNLIFDGFAQLNFFPVGTTGVLRNFLITSNEYIYLNTRAHAEYYKASYTDLSSVADAIRSKTGISDTLEFPTGFVSTIGDIIASANAAVIDVEVTNGTAAIMVGEFPDWCNGTNKDIIWGTVILSGGFVAEGISNTTAGLKTRVIEVDTYSGVSSILSYSWDRELTFGVTTDLSMTGFVTDKESQDGGFVPLTSGTFRVILVKCNPPEPVYPDER